MIVRCKLSYPTEEQIARLGPEFFRRRTFGIEPGEEYVVLGLTVDVGSRHMGLGPWVQIYTRKHVVHAITFVPLCLFEVTDARVSQHWEVRFSEGGTAVTLWPPSFYRPYYHDDLSEDMPEAVADFERVVKLLEDEARAG
ncbi:MAG: hypothetical protein KGL59_12020 [Acidobacteriota bacterium]|nr:hypothetical protein [Acidobacteriota bacterium]